MAAPPAAEARSLATAMDSIEPELRLLLEDEKCSPAAIKAIAENGWVSLKLMSRFARSEDDFYAPAKARPHMDADSATDPGLRIEVVKLCGDWQTAKRRWAKRGDAEAESSISGTPRQLPQPEHTALRDAFKLLPFGAELTPQTAPAEAWIERK